MGICLITPRPRAQSKRTWTSPPDGKS
jgi:hypothetical protein